MSARRDEILDEARRAATQCAQASRAHASLARALWKAGENESARATLRSALALGGGAPEDLEALGFAAFVLNEHHLSRDCYERVTRLAPGDGLAFYNLATAERNLGRLRAAEEACDEALHRDPNLHQAALLRSQLRVQTTTDNHVDALKERLRANTSALPARIFLNYALGKELEDLGEYDAAFAHFSAGAQARRGALSYTVQKDLNILSRLALAYPEPTRERVTGGRGHGFILGLPRSGTTLVERILTGHPAVTSNGETDNFSTALFDAAPPSPADPFERARLADAAHVERGYRKLAGPVRPDGLLLEKLPLNYLYVGAIRNCLPEAPIILVRRHPLDNAVAMFTTLFGAAYPFSYDLAELGAYVGAYGRLVDHWLGKFGDGILQTRYEDLVSKPEAWGERLAQFARAPWSPDLIQIERNTAPSTTASAVQIRRPIYTNAVGRWRNYARHLGPLVDALRKQGAQDRDLA